MPKRETIIAACVTFIINKMEHCVWMIITDQGVLHVIMLTRVLHVLMAGIIQLLISKFFIYKFIYVKR